MFPGAYFPGRYFAHRYFAGPTGAIVSAPAVVTTDMVSLGPAIMEAFPFVTVAVSAADVTLSTSSASVGLVVSAAASGTLSRVADVHGTLSGRTMVAASLAPAADVTAVIGEP